MNSKIVVINEIAANINIDSAYYKDASDTLGHEFCEGYYEIKTAGRQSIFISLTVITGWFTFLPMN
jgi:hypothetical protein